MNVQGDAQQRLAMLADATDTLFASLTLPHVFSAVGSLAERLLPADAHAVWRFDPAGPAWRAAWSSGLSDAFTTDITNWPGAPSPLVPFAGPLAARDVTIEPALGNRQAHYAAEGIRSLLAVPLRLGDENYGTVVAYLSAPGRVHRYRRAHRHRVCQYRLGRAERHAALRGAVAQSRRRRDRRTARALSRQRRGAARQLARLRGDADARRAARGARDCGLVRRRSASTPTAACGASRWPMPIRRSCGLVRVLDELYPEDPSVNYGRSHVIRTCSSILVPRITDEMIASAARDERHLAILRKVAPRAYVCVPLIAQGRAIGTLTFVSAEAGRAGLGGRSPLRRGSRRHAPRSPSRTRAPMTKRAAPTGSRTSSSPRCRTSCARRSTPILGYTRMLRRGAVRPSGRPTRSRSSNATPWRSARSSRTCSTSRASSRARCA